MADKGIVEKDSGIDIIKAKLAEEKALREKLERDLQISKKILHESQEVARLGSYELDVRDGTWTCTKTLEEIFGIDSDYPKNIKSWQSLIHPDSRDEMLEYFTMEVIAGRKLFNREYRIIQKASNELRWVHGFGRLQLNEEGEPVRMIGTIQDITDRKKSEELLIASEDKFSKAFQQHPTPMQIWDLKNWKRIEVNDSTAAFFEMTPGQMLKMHPYKNNFWKNPERMMELREKLLKDKIVRKLPIEVFNSKGEIRNLIVNASLLDIPGEMIVIISGLDVTEQLRAEQDLKEAIEELEALQSLMKEENLYLKEEIRQVNNFSEIIGESEPVVKMFKQIELVSPTDSAVLIQGETGTGKELVARAIHEHSSRNGQPLVKVNCPALPNELIESELFGHEKGAFTGAIKKKIGRFELANKGTIFLDEIGELSIGLQAKLLRVLQEGEFERVGSSETQKVDVRLLAATNRDLEQQVLDGTFRQDLYFRLNVFPIACPSLKERKEDIPLLVKHFISRFNPKMGKDIKIVNNKLLTRLMNYNWPGNIRELENTIERAMIFNQGTEFKLGDWFENHNLSTDDMSLQTLTQVEIHHILKVLEHTNWRIRGEKGAARILGMKPTTLESRMKKLGIKR